MQSTTERTEDMIRQRLIRVLAKYGRPFRPGELRQQASAYVKKDGAMFLRVLDQMIRDGTIWYEDGMVQLNIDVDKKSLARRVNYDLPESSAIPGVVKRIP